MRHLPAPDAIFGRQETTQEDKDAHGSRFRDVKAAIFANPYQTVWGDPNAPPLPHYQTTNKSVCAGSLPGGAPLSSVGFFHAAAGSSGGPMDCSSCAGPRWGQAADTPCPRGSAWSVHRAATIPQRPRRQPLRGRAAGGPEARRRAIWRSGSWGSSGRGRAPSAWQPTLTVQKGATARASPRRAARAGGASWLVPHANPHGCCLWSHTRARRGAHTPPRRSFQV
jgi:hypothetical protein